MKLELMMLAVFMALKSIKTTINPPPNGLGFNDSVQQAKQQLKYFFVRDKPVEASLANLEDYYVDIDEKNMKNLHPKKQLRRPCKVLPDPQPGLVNPKLVAPVHSYKPLYTNEKFYGKFAPPMKLNYFPAERAGEIDSWTNNNQGRGRFLSTLKQKFQKNDADNSLQNDNTGPSVMYTKGNEMVAGNLRNRDDSRENYFRSKIDYGADLSLKNQNQTYNRINHRKSDFQHPTTTWKENLATDYAQRLSSMSAALMSNSIALQSMQLSATIDLMKSQWAQKEASLRGRLSSYSATSTTTYGNKRKGWPW